MIVLPPEVAQDAVWQNIVKQMNDELLHIEANSRGAHARINDLEDALRDSTAAKLKLIKV
jgi:hypothetical protein